MANSKKIYDVIVIGGGPAGMMAAGRAAELGQRVLLLEKNASLGKKLLITGGGRCNVTNAEFDERRFLAKFKDAKKFLFSPFARFSVKETIDFFEHKNMPIKIEAENRAFPVSNSAKSVWEVLVAYMKASNVEVMTNSAVSGFQYAYELITGVQLKNKTLVQANNYILATGGTSRPETGSTGDGFGWLKTIGHTVIEQSAALVPVMIKEKWVHTLAGVSLSEVKATVLQNNIKQATATGKLLFTHFGLSGPLILNMSRDIGELLKYGPVSLILDIMPGRDMADINAEILNKLQENHTKRLRNALSGLVQTSLLNAIIKVSGIDAGKPANSVTRSERQQLVQLLKKLPMTPTGLMGLDKAIIASGGVKLEEVDFKTMRSKLFSNLYLVGDILNIDRPSGGYSLQLCWTTGYVAGSSAAQKSL